MYGIALLTMLVTPAAGPGPVTVQDVPLSRKHIRLADGPAPLTEGDSPLTTIDSFAGRVDVVVDVIENLFTTPTGGTFTVTGIPAGATILRAWLQITSFDAFPELEVTTDFEGNVMEPRVADVADPANILFCSLYDRRIRWPPGL